MPGPIQFSQEPTPEFVEHEKAEAEKFYQDGEEAEVAKLLCTIHEYNDKNFFLKRVATVLGIGILIAVGIVITIITISLVS